MSAKKIAIANMKGGVGKTSLTLMLADGLASGHGKRVLVIDLDAQANSSIAIAGEERYRELVKNEQTLVEFFECAFNRWRQRPLSHYVYRDSEYFGAAGSNPVHLLATAPDMQFLEREVIAQAVTSQFARTAPEGHATKTLGQGLEAMAKDYDYIFFDCPPGISLFAEAGIRNADLVMPPVAAEYLSLVGLDGFINKALPRLGRDAKAQNVQAIAVVNRYSGSRSEQEYLTRIAGFIEPYKPRVQRLNIEIPRRADIAAAIEQDSPKRSLKDRWQAAAPDVEELTDRFLEAMDAAF